MKIIDGQTITTVSFEGKKLLEIREALGVNQKELAEALVKNWKIKVSTREIKALETGGTYGNSTAMNALTRWVIENHELSTVIV